MNILVTGGAGFLGSHTSVELLAHNHSVVVIDNLSNSVVKAVKRVEEISGKSVQFYEGDLRDESLLRDVFTKNHIDAVIHFAGLKAVGESVEKPLLYYQNNLDSTLSLCKVMHEQGVKKLIFSSTATVYSPTNPLPWREDGVTGLGIPHPYGRTKYMIEEILRDLTVADPSWEIITLRYFNPIGAHPSGKIGEDPHDIPNNLMPYVSQVAVGKRDTVRVFGNDYDTPDGTGVRDYIHVVDLAKGHVAALEHLQPAQGMRVYNLGAGKGASVLEVIHAFSHAASKEIPYEIVARRPGDLATYYADVSKAERELNWKVEQSLEDACRDSWRWQSQNPNGYRD